MAVVLGIVKAKRALWPRFVDVRKHTFCLYLTHTFWIVLLPAGLKRILPHFADLSWWRGGAQGFLLLLVMFCLIYAGCLLTAKALLSNPRLRWTVGQSAQNGARIGNTQEVSRSVGLMKGSNPIFHEIVGG